MCWNMGIEVRGLVEKSNYGKCCEPDNYIEVADIICWCIENPDSDEEKQIGMNGKNIWKKN